MTSDHDSKVPNVRIAPKHMAYPICGNCGSKIHINHEHVRPDDIQVVITIRYWRCDNCGQRMIIDEPIGWRIHGDAFTSDSMDKINAHYARWQKRNQEVDEDVGLRYEGKS